MISVSSEVLDLFDEGRIIIRGLIRFDFGTGTYGFINSDQPLTYNSLLYKPGGMIKVSDLAESPGLVASAFSISLAASPDDDLTPDVLATIEAEDYRDRPVTVSDAYFHPDTGALIYVQKMMRGYIDTIDHIDTVESGYTIIANGESRSLDYTRKNGRKRSDQDQRRRSATDGFFLQAAMRGREEVLWGRTK
jgi:hypothetical protein